MNKLLLTLIFFPVLLSNAVLAAEKTKENKTETTLETVEIHPDDSAPKGLKKEKQYRTHQSTTVESPVYDEHLGKTLSKLPGVLVRNQSGPGSLTTVTSPQAISSAATQVSVDNIPIVDPSGIGINVSLFPRALIEAVEYQSAFYQNVDPISVPVLTPGGRINIRTQSYSYDEPEKRIGGNLTFGSAYTAEGSAAYRRKKSHKERPERGFDYAIGVTGHSTRGDFSYKNPKTATNDVRKNNDSNSISAMEKFRRRTSESGVFDFVLMVSTINRTNPGSLDFPGRDHERDTFKLMGFSFSDPKLFNEKTGLFAKASGTLSRVQNDISADTRTDAHTVGGYGQFGINSTILGENTVAYFDHTFEKLNDGSGKHERNSSTLNLINTYDLGFASLTPYFKLLESTHYYHVPSGSLTLSREWSDELSSQVSHGYFVAQPPIMAKSGYYAGSLVVLPNDRLLLERSNVTNISNLWSNGKFEIHSTFFHHFIRDRAAYTSIDFTQSQYRNVSKATALGHTLSLNSKFTEDLSAFASGTIQRAWQNAGGHDFPYKPRTQGVGGLTRSFYKGENNETSFTVEEEWVGKRFINLTDESIVSPYAQTNLRIDFKSKKILGGMGAFFKASNLFNTAGFVTDGFPLPGRLFYLGVEI